VVVIYSGYHFAQVRVLRGDSPHSAFGAAIAAVGDQDGDGVPDLAVSAPLAAPQGAPGEIQVRSGKTGACIRRYPASVDEIGFGIDIAAIGDIDGDKRQDLLIHCRVGSKPQQRERFVVIGSRDGSRLNVITGQAALDCVFEGCPVASMLDIDGDGVPDYAIELGRQVRVISGKSGADIRKFGEVQPT
jgi:hypothetical protein